MKKLLYTLLVYASLLNGQAQETIPYQPDLKQIWEWTDSCDVDLRAPHKPLIGLSASHQNGRSTIPGAYIQSVLKAGGSPVIIPAITDGETLRSIVAHLDGLILTGGADINPLWYGEQPIQQLKEVDPIRDQYELKLLKLAADRNIPILGICRGEQLINVAFGGTLYQDIPSQREKHIKHVQSLPDHTPSHHLTVVAGSQLEQITGKKKLMANSCHHQAVKEVAPGFRATAFASDSTIEAIEAWPDRPILGVQWHPEELTVGGDTIMLKLFRFLVGEADRERIYGRRDPKNGGQ